MKLQLRSRSTFIPLTNWQSEIALALSKYLTNYTPLPWSFYPPCTFYCTKIYLPDQPIICLVSYTTISTQKTSISEHFWWLHTTTHLHSNLLIPTTLRNLSIRHNVIFYLSLPIQYAVYWCWMLLHTSFLRTLHPHLSHSLGLPLHFQFFSLA